VEEVLNPYLIKKLYKNCIIIIISKNENIEYIHYVGIENLNVEILDPYFLGLSLKNNS